MKSKQTIHEVKQFKVSDLHKHPSNPRTLKDTAYNTLKQSIEANPELLEARPLILSNRTGKNIVIGGNQRLQVVKDLGWLHVPCVLFPDMSEKKEREIMIRDNVSNGDWDWDKLANEWDSAELNYWGLEVSDWEQEQEEYEGQTDQDAAPELETEAVTRLGDLWLLGEHRLLCGDSTDKAAVDLLMNGQKADMVFTDPPYGMFLDADYSSMDSKFKGSSGGNKYKNIIGDHEDFNPDFINIIFQIFNDTKEIFLWGADYYSELIKDKNLGSWIVWDKRLDESADKMFGISFELCWSKCRHKRAIARVKWAGIFGMEKEPEKKRLHPTQKPIELCVWFLDSFAKSLNIIVDLFLGSGSTLIACEKTGRKCYGIELSPQYCDVIIKRWQDFSGKQATLETTGETFEEVKNGRAS